MYLSKLNREDIEGRIFLVRFDFNAHLSHTPEGIASIIDATRIEAARPTIEHILNNGGKLVGISHLDRPNGIEPKWSLRPVFDYLQNMFPKNQGYFAEDCTGKNVPDMIRDMENGKFLLLENLRFHREEQGYAEDRSKEANIRFAKTLASYATLGSKGGVYVNDAFGTMHRGHGSVTGIPEQSDLECYAGLLVEKELQALSVLSNPEKPYVAIVGGRKVNTKIGVVENLMKKTDTILIGGAISYAFMAAQGISTGDYPNLNNETVKTARRILDKQGKKGYAKVFLPSDHVIAKECSESATSKSHADEDIPKGWLALDIGTETIQTYKEVIQGAGTILWNGPMGTYEFEPFFNGTRTIAEAVADSNAISIVGGGYTGSAVNKVGLSKKMKHVSTGGGAMIEFAEKGNLPGLAALRR